MLSITTVAWPYRAPMSADHLEIETKFDVPHSFVVPDLTGVDGVATVDDPVVHDLEAQYFDTGDLRLARARITLRRRTGGTDDGWHLKLPAAREARRELHSPLGRAVKRPPQALVAPVLGVLRGAAVAPVASLHTRRVVRMLRDGAGRALAEVADDTVTATALAGPEGVETQTWREVEVELVDGEAAVLAPIGERLVEAGASRTARASKLARAQGLDPGEERSAQGGAGGRRAERKKGGRRKAPRAADVVPPILAALVAELETADIGMRTHQGDGVHRMRIACRRLRGVLAALRRVLDREVTDPLRDELAWLAGRLSDARDDEVALAHLRAAVAELPAELVLGPVAARLQAAEIQAHETGRAKAAELLADRRYLGLLDALHALLDDPPLTGAAGKSAEKVLGGVLAAEAMRLRTSVRAADHRTGQERTDALHEVRKSAKRARYTAEVTVPVLGGAADRVRKVGKKTQVLLGALQDTVVVRERCRRLAVAAQAAGESAFTYGLLLGREELRAREAEREFTSRWPDLEARLPG